MLFWLNQDLKGLRIMDWRCHRPDMALDTMKMLILRYPTILRLPHSVWRTHQFKDFSSIQKFSLLNSYNLIINQKNRLVSMMQLIRRIWIGVSLWANIFSMPPIWWTIPISLIRLFVASPNNHRRQSTDSTPTKWQTNYTCKSFLCCW
jgi:hypothetical protein